MLSTRAVQTIYSLSEAELKELGKFIRSPYFNSNKKLIKLFELIKAEFPEPDEKKLKKEFLYEQLFDGRPYNEQIMKNLSSQLYGLCMEFLAVNKYRNRNANDLELDILNELNTKRLDNIFHSRLKHLERSLEDSTHMIHPLFYHLHRVETLKTQYMLSRDKQKFTAESVLKSGDYLIFYFITELSRIAIDINANMNTFNISHRVNLVFEVLDKFDFKGIIDYLNINNYAYSKMLNVYYHRLVAVLDSGDENFYTFKKLLEENKDSFSLYELASLLDSLHNMAIQRVNDGISDAHLEEFNIIKMKLDYGTIAVRTGGRISLLTFRNVVFTSIRLGEIEWGEDFVKKYIDKVNPDSRESIYNHSMGIYAFYKNNLEEAVKYLNRVALENPFLASDVKTHLAIIFFLQGYYDSCLSVMDSFRHMLSSKEDFSAVFRQVNLHFINALTNMIKVKTGSKNPDSLVKIKQKLESRKMVNHKGWLLKTIDEMSKENN